jgi:hypothetical protein
VSDRDSRPPTGRFNRPQWTTAGDGSLRRRWRFAAEPVEEFKPGGPRIRRYRLAALASRDERPATTPTR